MLVECVPNFSEGRDKAKVDAIASAAGAVVGAAVLDVHTDADHHRCVVTIAGKPDAVCEAAFRATARAVALIDMTRHQGVHPRLGAADVVPFVPLRGATLADCVALAGQLGERLAHELSLPVYFYGEAARRPERVRLPWLREPGFERLDEALQSVERAPDLGPARRHPTAGAVVVGARGLLVAFNVDLATTDVAVARRIARAIRASSGGLPGVQAKGLHLPKQGRVQVTMNLLDPTRVGPGYVFHEVERRAAREGVDVQSSEIVGLIPRLAAVEATEHLLKLRRPLEEHVLENRLDACLGDPGGPFWRTVARIEAPGPYEPGGGAAAALALALARACLGKALALSRGGKGALDDAGLDALAAGLPPAPELIELANRDHQAFTGLMSALKRERGDPGREAAVAAARGPAVAVPDRQLEVALALAEAAARVAADGNRNLVNDAVAAAELALAAGRVASLNAAANERGPAPPGRAERLARLVTAAEKARAAAQRPA